MATHHASIVATKDSDDDCWEFLNFHHLFLKRGSQYSILSYALAHKCMLNTASHSPLLKKKKSPIFWLYVKSFSLQIFSSVL